MQVFIPYDDPKEVAKCLDIVRLHKQIIEADFIISCIEKYHEHNRTEEFLRHPVMKMYKDGLEWLRYYRQVLYLYRTHRNIECWDGLVEPKDKPIFLSYKPLLDCHKKRLYQKGKSDQKRRSLSSNHYSQFADFDSDNEDNLYIIDEIIFCYRKGKLISKIPLYRDGLSKEDLVDLKTFIQISQF